MKVDFPAPLGPRRPVIPGSISERDVAQPEDVPVPLGEVPGFDDGRHLITSTPRIRLCRTAADTAQIPNRTRKDR